MNLSRLLPNLMIILAWTEVESNNTRHPPPQMLVERFAKEGASWEEILETYMNGDSYTENCFTECWPNEICKHGMCVCKCGYVGPRCVYLSSQSSYSFQLRLIRTNVKDLPFTLPNDQLVELIDHTFNLIPKYIDTYVGLSISGYVPYSFRIVKTWIE